MLFLLLLPFILRLLLPFVFIDAVGLIDPVAGVLVIAAGVLGSGSVADVCADSTVDVAVVLHVVALAVVVAVSGALLFSLPNCCSS